MRYYLTYNANLMGRLTAIPLTHQALLMRNRDYPLIRRRLIGVDLSGGKRTLSRNGSRDKHASRRKYPSFGALNTRI